MRGAGWYHCGGLRSMGYGRRRARAAEAFGSFIGIGVPVGFVVDGTVARVGEVSVVTMVRSSRVEEDSGDGLEVSSTGVGIEVCSSILGIVLAARRPVASRVIFSSGSVEEGSVDHMMVLIVEAL
ncbi:hypothetical protein GUJ93_ZPchr0011g28772 [Zizania palustris]|uniref:Uncharacterized protein n=1 Tax=Zizania palustris TaxID=103762 RepID=A0A8J5WGT9_ZIZPA|nr:hypothetical protein GUJ93_ZPchr0011g28772 [Zizania palustris]